MALIDRYRAWNKYYGLPVKPPPPKPKKAAPLPPEGAMPGRALINQLFPTMPTRTEAQWNTLLDARVKPFINAIDRSTQVERAQSEFQFERAAAANQGLGEAFTKILTGGRTGAEAEQFAKEQFGGQYLPAQAMTVAADRLSDLTSQWDERDWKISSQYMQAMAEVPGIREQLRADIQNQDTNEYERRFKYATLLLDEAWNAYNAKAKAATEATQLRMAQEAIRRQQGMVGYETRKDAVSEAGRLTDDTGRVWRVKRVNGEWVPYDTKKPKAKPATKGTNEVSYRNSALTEARDMTRVDTTIWGVKKVNGQWTAYDTGKKKAAPAEKKKTGLSEAQQTENQIVAEFYSNRDKYLGSRKKNPFYTPNAPGVYGQEYIVEGGLDYDQAYRELYDYVYAILKPFGRADAYIEKFVRDRLRAFYPNQTMSGRPRKGD